MRRHYDDFYEDDYRWKRWEEVCWDGGFSWVEYRCPRNFEMNYECWKYNCEELEECLELFLEEADEQEKRWLKEELLENGFEEAERIK